MAKKNFTISTVATAPDPATTGTTLDVPSGKGSLFAEDEVALIFPDGEQPDITNAEIVLVTDVTADTLTITREQEGTTARTVVVGDIIFQQISAGNWNDLITAVGSNTTHRGLTNNPHSVDAGDIGVEAGATADQTGSEIKTAYEGEADTNAFTDAEETKVGHISVTQAVNLDTMESNIATNNDKITYPSAASDKLATIEESADVTDATNVNSAGATMNTDSDVKANSWTIDEDDMTSNVDTKVPTQQSVKKYVDDKDSMILDATPDSDHTSSGTLITLTANANVVFGDVCYIDSDGEAAIIDADAIATMSAVVMAVATIDADASGLFLLQGIARDDTWDWTVGGLIYGTVTGTTTNTLSQTAPTGTDDVVQIMGVATHADRILFNPQLVQIERT